MRNAWLTELSAIAGLLLVGALLGWQIGHWGWLTAMGLLLYGAWHITQLVRLFRALAGGAEPPESIGLWGALLDLLYQRKRAYELDHRRLTHIIGRYEQTSSALPDAVVVLAADETVEWCNSAAVQLLGLRKPTDYGQRVTNLIRNPTFTRYVNTGQGDATVEFPAPTDERLMLTARLVHYGQSSRLLVARDITRLRHLEAVRRDFVANASHELRTPLTVVLGFLEKMTDDLGQAPPPWQRPLKVMNEQAVRMKHIVDDMLVLARLEDESTEPEMAPVNMPWLVDKVRQEAENLSGARQHRVRANVDATLWCTGNEGELRSALSNLVNNAVLYTPDRSRIDIHWQQHPDGLVLQVSDDGEGIPPEHLPRLAERFYRVDPGRSRSRGGTGLGLAIVRHVVLRHDGEFDIDSTLGEGSTFTCRLPLRLALRQPEGGMLAAGL